MEERKVVNMKQYWNKTTETWQETPPPRPPKAGYYIQGDLEPYQAVTGDIIQGRRQHREFMRNNGYVEVGNEKIQRKHVEPPQAHEAVREAMGKAGLL